MERGRKATTRTSAVLPGESDGHRGPSWRFAPFEPFDAALYGECLSSPYPGKVHLPPPVRRPEGSRREAHIPTKQPSSFEEAWLPCPYGDGRRPSDPEGPSGQGPLQAVGLTRRRFFPRSRTLSGVLIDPITSLRRAPRVGRVHGPQRFRALQRSRTRSRSGPIKVSWAPGDSLCVAYAIPTSVGNAVQRNTVRRRLRDAVAANAACVASGDVLVRVIAPADQCTWAALSRAVTDTLGHIGRAAPTGARR